MKYEEAYAYIEECNKLGSVLGLESIKNLADQLGNPQDALKFVHIAGTNGKGSVLAFVSTTLTKLGLKVGRYMSPTVFHYLDRFQINGRNMSKTAYGEYMDQLKAACDSLVKEGKPHPTSFEIETAMAFCYFKDQGCDIVVLETGMGGRLDATNMIQTQIATILTSISMDHMQFLGDTLEKIATEKCGIIRDHVPVITIEQDREAMAVIEKACAEKQAPLIVANTDDIHAIKYGINKQSFTYKKEKYEITLAGSYQIANAYLALRAIKVICEQYNSTLEDHKKPVLFTIKKIQQAFLNTQWKGRFSVISKKPYFIIDGAHNVDAAKRLMESISFYFTNKRILYIMGMFKDKEYEKVVELTAGRASHIITVATPHNERALDALSLAQVVRKSNEHVTATDSLEEAVEMSYLLSDKDTVILAFGSLSYLGKICEIVEKGQVLRSDTHGK